MIFPIGHLFAIILQVNITLGLLYIRLDKGRYRNAVHETIMRISREENLARTLIHVKASPELMGQQEIRDGYYLLVSWLNKLPANRIQELGADVQQLIGEASKEIDIRKPKTWWHRVYNFYEANWDNFLVTRLLVAFPIAIFWALVGSHYMGIIWHEYVFNTLFVLMAVLEVLPVMFITLGNKMNTSVAKEFYRNVEFLSYALSVQEVQDDTDLP